MSPPPLLQVLPRSRNVSEGVHTHLFAAASAPRTSDTVVGQSTSHCQRELLRKFAIHHCVLLRQAGNILRRGGLLRCQRSVSQPTSMFILSSN